MKSSALTNLLVALPLAAGLLLGCSKKTVEPAGPTTGRFALEIEPVVGASSLVLNAQSYTKADGQSFTVSKFKFLLSNIKLTKADGTTYAVPNGYYLIDATDSDTFHFILDEVPLGDYTGLSFMVGLDPTRNNGTFQSGPINHSNDLYWEWSKEYVFLKMAGSRPGSSRGLTFDIGGNACARTAAPSFAGKLLTLRDGHVPEIHLYADVKAMFESTTPANNINFDNTYSVESGHAKAPVVADNYAAGMFRIGHIHAN